MKVYGAEEIIIGPSCNFDVAVFGMMNLCSHIITFILEDKVD